MRISRRHSSTALVLFFFVWAGPAAQTPPPSAGEGQTPDRAPFRFRSGIDLVNVTVTVSDSSGRFVNDLRREDFLVFDDGKLVEVTQFSAERVPVSLGIALDTSGSMAGTKIQEARAALDRFANDLLDRQDEIFVYVFSNYPLLLQGWTTNRRSIAEALGDIRPSGGTALYDTVLRALPLAAQGRHPKKALVVISDGNDTTSHADIHDVTLQIRKSDVLVYAIGIDGNGESVTRRPLPRPPVPFPPPFFPPWGGGHGPFRQWPPGSQQGSGGWSRQLGDHVNVGALRELTDVSGGRTEVIRDPRDLNPATAGIADELSRQYYLGYPSPAQKDGRWHTIRVEVRNSTYRIRARSGYTASQP